MKTTAITFILAAMIIVAVIPVTTWAADPPAKPDRVQLTQQQQIGLHNLAVILQYASEQQAKAQVALDLAKRAYQEAQDTLKQARDQVRQAQCQDCEWAPDALELIRKPQPKK